MPSLVIPPVIGGFGDTNLTAASREGTGVTASGTTHTKGAYSILVDPTTKPSYGCWVRTRGVGAPNTNTSMLVDLAYGPTGGGSEEILVSNIDAGASSNPAAGHGKWYYFPIYIPTGVAVSARCQSAIASDNVTVAIRLCQDPSYRWACGAVTTYGADTATSNGTPITPANGSFGSWTQVGAGTDPVRAHRFFSFGYSIGTDTAQANAEWLLELGTGPDASNVSTIAQFSGQGTSAEEVSYISYPVYGPVVAGGELWARIASGEAEIRRVIVYGMD